MAITSASGGFNGNFSPIIYSKQAQIALRKTAVVNRSQTTPTSERSQTKAIQFVSKKSQT